MASVGNLGRTWTTSVVVALVLQTAVFAVCLFLILFAYAYFAVPGARILITSGLWVLTVGLSIAEIVFVVRGRLAAVRRVSVFLLVLAAIALVVLAIEAFQVSDQNPGESFALFGPMPFPPLLVLALLSVGQRRRTV